MKNLLKLNTVKTLVFLCIFISGCNTVTAKSNEIRSGEIIMLENLKVIDTYSFYEKDNDLFFQISLKNNTNESFEVGATIQPFSVYYKDEVLESNTIIPSLSIGTPRAVIVIKPNESHDFIYKISKEYQYMNGEHDYELTYLYHFYDAQINKDFDGYPITFKFRWQTEEGNDKGKLISTNFRSE